jgi:hypothetical protein
LGQACVGGKEDRLSISCLVLHVLSMSSTSERAESLMGIRVTKVLGYGLTDVKTRKYNIADSRINRKSPLLNYDAKETLDDYLDWLRASTPDENALTAGFNIDRWYFKEREEADFDWYKKTGATIPADLIHHGTEYMEKNVLLIRPLFCKDWQRHDDPIDYIEEGFKYKDVDTGVANWCREIPEGIFPWSGSFMNSRTGEPVKDGITLWRVMTWKNWDKIYDLEETAIKCGFDSVEDMKANFAPQVPESIRDLVKWGKLFTNDDVWKQLRPMIYTYWS